MKQERKDKRCTDAMFGFAAVGSGSISFQEGDRSISV